MFVDAPAVIAILASEPDATALSAKLDAATDAYTSPMSQYESVLGLARATRASSGPDVYRRREKSVAVLPE